MRHPFIPELRHPCANAIDRIRRHNARGRHLPLEIHRIPRPHHLGHGIGKPTQPHHLLRPHIHRRDRRALQICALHIRGARLRKRQLRASLIPHAGAHMTLDASPYHRDGFGREVQQTQTRIRPIFAPDLCIVFLLLAPLPRLGLLVPGNKCDRLPIRAHLELGDATFVLSGGGRVGLSPTFEG